VLDYVTRLPIRDATVNVYKLNTTQLIGTTKTGDFGIYELEIPSGIYDIEFIKAGYETELLKAVEVRTWWDYTALEPVYLDDGTGFPRGSGSLENPFLIARPDHLDFVRNNLSAHYKLKNDIDLAEWGNWTPIGSYENPFTGTFDGDEYSVKNIYVRIDQSANVYAGLFGYISGAEIKNLEMSNGTVWGRSASYYSCNAGSIVGYMHASTIDNCYSTVNVSAYSNSLNCSVYAGGIVGYAGNSSPASTIKGCSNTGSIYAYAPLSVDVGGIVGRASGSSNSRLVLISDFNNKGSVKADSSTYYAGNTKWLSAGGIVGDASYCAVSNCQNNGIIDSLFLSTGDPSSIVNSCVSSAGGIIGKLARSTISQCFNKGTITASTLSHTSSCAGGIAGYVDTTCQINDCYNKGYITAPVTTSSDSYAGGIAGYTNIKNTIVNSCYNTGSIVRSPSVTSGYFNAAGGIIGYLDFENTARNSYFLSGTATSGVAGQNNSSGTIVENILSLNEVQMKEDSSFIGFDFTNTWAINPTINNGYPYLRGMQDNASPDVPATGFFSRVSGGAVGSVLFSAIAGASIALVWYYRRKAVVAK